MESCKKGTTPDGVAFNKVLRTDLIFHLLDLQCICPEMGVKDATHRRLKSLTPISRQIKYQQANEGLIVVQKSTVLQLKSEACGAGLPFRIEK